MRRPIFPGSARFARGNAGFTLAEVAVTIVIVGIGLTLILQGMNTAKMAAVNNHNTKLARDLALETLGEVESGLFTEDLEDSDDILTGSYAERGYPNFYWEICLGDETFPDLEDRADSQLHDSWRPSEYEEELDEEEEDEDDESTEPYEKVKIRITFPPLQDYKNTMIFERWMAWEQVYGPEEEEEDLNDGEPAPEPEDTSDDNRSGANAGNGNNPR